MNHEKGTNINSVQYTPIIIMRKMFYDKYEHNSSFPRVGVPLSGRYCLCTYVNWTKGEKEMPVSLRMIPLPISIPIQHLWSGHPSRWCVFLP